MLSAVMEEAKHQLFSQHPLPFFRFIPALSPWSGGMYERMIGLIKRCLVRAGATKTLLSEEDLRTHLKEAEAIINARPLTYVSNNDMTPIRPVDLVFPNKRFPTVLTVEETLDSSPLSSSHQVLLENWMRTSSIIDHFINRWKEEYVQVLQSRNQTEHRQDRFANKTPLAVGDVVMIENDGNKVNWPLARVESLGPRAAKLFVPRTGRVIERPFKKIYQLEVDATSKDSQPLPIAIPQPATSSSQPSTSTAPSPSTSSGPLTRSRARLSGIIPSNIFLAMLTMSLLFPATFAQESTTPSTDLSASAVLTAFTQFSQLMAIGLVIGILTTGIHLLLTFLKCSRQMFYCCRFLIHQLGILFRCICSSLFGKKKRNQPRIIVLTTLMLLPSTIQCCNDIAHIAAQEKACYEHVNATQCHVNSVSLINVRANGSTSCLEIQHENNAPLATLKITAEALVSYCEKRNLFFSRDFRLQHEFIKRCDSAGSCSIDMCGNIKADEDLPELSQSSKSHPGFTNCAPGCGGWHCSCWYYDPSCLFYRYYATPTSNDIYELYHCPTWSTQLRLKIELGALKLTVDVAPGIKYSIIDTNISLTAVGIHTPPLQAHSATYISAYGLGSNTPRWTSYTFTPTSSPGTPSKGFSGELQCKGKKAAEDFNCLFDPTLCKCVGFATLVNCRCKNEKMKDYRLKNKLPTRGINHNIIMVNNRVTTLTTQETTISVQVEITNATISRLTTVQTCNATQSGKIKGCFSCLEGANIPVTCTARKRMRALMSCGIIETTLECGPYGRTNSITIGYNMKEVQLNCSVECGHRTFISIQGELTAVEAFNQSSAFYSSPFEQIAAGTIEIGQFFQDVAEKVIKFFLPHPWIMLFIIGLIFIPYAMRIAISRRISYQRKLIITRRRAKYM